MIPLAHVGGVPTEKFLPWLVGPGTGLVVARAWTKCFDNLERATR